MKHIILVLVFALFGGSVVKASQTGQESGPAPLKKELAVLIKAYNESTDKNSNADIARQINTLYTDAKNRGVVELFKEVINESPQPDVITAQLIYILREEHQDEIPNSTEFSTDLQKKKTELQRSKDALEDLKRPQGKRSIYNYNTFTEQQVPDLQHYKITQQTKLIQEISAGEKTLPLLERLEKGERIRVIDPSANQPTSPPATTTSNLPLKIIGGAMLLAATAYGLVKLYHWYKLV